MMKLLRDSFLGRLLAALVLYAALVTAWMYSSPLSAADTMPHAPAARAAR